MNIKFDIMKLRKLLTFCFVLSVVLFSCEDDENEMSSITPRVDFAFSPTAPVDGDEIVFTSEVLEPSSNIVSWHWSFYDKDSTTSAEANPTFVYEEPGTYPVTLDVVDANENAFRIVRPVVVAKAEFPATVVWEFTNNTTVARLNEGSNAPALAEDGTVYYVEGNAADLSTVVAVNDLGETAELKWATVMGNQVSNAPSIAPDGHIYINTWDAASSIAKLDGATGAIMWTGSVGTGVSNNTPAVDSEGNAYHGSRYRSPDGGAYSWTAGGEKRWEITGVGAFYAAPVLSADEQTVYFLNTNEGNIWAVNTADGTLKWDASVGLGTGIHGSSLSMDADGTIYFTTNTHVVAVTDNGTTGSVKWSTEVNDAANSGVVIGPQGELYTGSLGGLISLNPADGTIVWTYEDAEVKESVPAVDVNGNVYVGTTDGRLVIVNSSGNLEKELQLGDNVVNSPTISADGTVYVEVLNETVIKLFKIAVENSGPADSPWPMKGQNAKNTGKAAM